MFLYQGYPTEEKLKTLEKMLDPACGTGGFLVETYRHLEKQSKKRVWYCSSPQDSAN